MRLKSFYVFGVIAAFIAAVYSCDNDHDLEFKRYYTAGALIYADHCQNCHGKNGEGLSNLMPPLTDSVFLRKNNAQLSCITTYGANQLIIINGKPYSTQMPVTNLAPIEVAEVLTYVKNSFGNKQGMVNVNEVNNNLKNCK